MDAPDRQARAGQPAPPCGDTLARAQAQKSPPACAGEIGALARTTGRDAKPGMARRLGARGPGWPPVCLAESVRAGSATPRMDAYRFPWLETVTGVQR